MPHGLHPSTRDSGACRGPGLKRYHHSKQSHFITFSCYRRLHHLAEPEARDMVVAALERAH
jgi:hypothetical protein